MPIKFKYSNEEVAKAAFLFRLGTEGDPFWRDANYEELVRFWCSDLSATEYGNDELTAYIVFEPSGKAICFDPKEEGAWKKTLALIYWWTCLVREERDEHLRS